MVIPRIATNSWLVSSTLIATALTAVAGESPVSYGRAVRPILANHCFRCHGPDAGNRKANLRLDVREIAIERAAIVPGNPEASGLVKRTRSEDAESLMPPPDVHKPLAPEQMATLERWIAQGAEYETHWSYSIPRRSAPPAVACTDWPRDAIDAFVLARLEANGIAPSPEADRQTLLRRVSLDLTGLPPTDAEVEEFVASADPRAYEIAVDRLLASPHFGERMAVFWLDVARYADTVGYHGDQNLHAFPYRDWVIDAFNRDLPFDRFTVEQLAGDLLPNATVSQRVATGFNRLNMVTREGGAQPGEYLAKYAADRVRTVATTWLGSTLGCAECHDHKYDPFTMRDFYGLAAFFADVKQWGVYTTYAYTPNPDLAGYTNDHPFPPEITVPVPYLAQRIERQRSRIREFAATAGEGARADGALGHAFAEWRDASREFLSRSPDGFETPAPRILEPPSATQGDDARVVLPADSKDAIRISLASSTRSVAAIRVELLPDPAHDGKVLRGGARDGYFRFSATLVSANSGRETPLPFRAGEGERALPRYANGNAIRGIVSGWHFDTEGAETPARALMYLERPQAIESGDTIVVKIAGIAGAVRVALSPFATEDPLATEPLRLLGPALESADPLADPLVLATWLRSTRFDEAAFSRVIAADRDIRECDGGVAPTVVTESWEPRPVRVLPRGNWQDESGALVEPGPPQFMLDPSIVMLDPSSASGMRRLTRLDLAEWLVAPSNPLVARVFVNRLWKQLFGAALSGVVDDLGMQGEAPSHPELLDTLAVDFRESGWSVKSLVRRIVTSTTYRQRSDARIDLREIDPGNRLLAAQAPRRLDAEFVRDNALLISGLLTQDIGGPPVMPWQPARLYEHLQFPDRDWEPDLDDRQWRRGVYMHWQRTFLHPMLAAFDAPSREECTASRVVANTPQQALTLLNDPTFVEAARAFAARLLESGASDDRTRIDHAFRRALARPANEAEIDSLVTFLAARRAEARERPEEAARLLGVGVAQNPSSLDPAELAAWTHVCRVVLNLHECLTRY